jgi:hypothetical protein
MISRHFPPYPPFLPFRYDPFLFGKNAQLKPQMRTHLFVYHYFHVFTIYLTRLFWNVSMFAVYLLSPMTRILVTAPSALLNNLSRWNVFVSWSTYRWPPRSTCSVVKHTLYGAGRWICVLNDQINFLSSNPILNFSGEHWISQLFLFDAPLTTGLNTNSKIPWYHKLLFQRENALASFWVQRVLVAQPNPPGSTKLFSNLIAAIFVLTLKVSARRTENWAYNS